MPLLPVLPVLPNESLTSYLNRAARFHAETAVLEFLAFLEFPQWGAMSPQEEHIDRLADLFGLTRETLSAMTFLPLGGRMRSFCGEVVHSEFANLDKTSFCPACLLEDGDPKGPSAGLRVGRIHWRIEHVRTCEQHGIALVRRKHANNSEKFQRMDAVAPPDEELAVIASEAAPQRLSDLQVYLMDSLAGAKGPLWLDSQPIDLAARACEMLGIILTAGTHVNLKTLPDTAWNEAGNVGFGYACRGEEGIMEALQLAFDRFESAGVRGGPQKVLGRLYQWLQFSKNDKPTGPIREIVRDFILDHFPIAKGVELFGEPVDRQRVHSAQSLSEKTGVHHKTIYRAVVLAGLVDGDPDHPSSTKVFDAVEGEALMERIRTSIPQKHLTDYLNCNRVQAEQLVRTGIIPRLLPDAAGVKGVLKQIAQEDADDFLSRFLGAATLVESPSESVMDVVSAAEISRWPVVDIVNGILGGLFDTVEITDQDLKFKGVLVDPMEVRETLSREQAQGRVGLDEAARIIGMPRHGLSAVAKIRKSDGTPYVTEHFVENSKGARTRLFAVEELRAFLREHVSLTEIAAKEHFSVKVMKMKMDGRGAVPLTPKYELGRVWYRKADVLG